MKLALVVALAGTLCLVWGDALGNTCASFDLPDPEVVDGEGRIIEIERRVLWGESYCKELTLDQLNGKTPKLCVRNENPKDKAPTGCLRLSLRHVDPAMIKELRVGIHPDCSSIPTEVKDKFQRRRNATKLTPGKKMGAIRICFDEIPAASTCCETEQCLVFEAIVEVAGVDTKVTIKDDACSSDEGCPYSIGCPNLINEANKDCVPGCALDIWNGTNSNDLFIVSEDEVNDAYLGLFKGYDVVIGSEGTEIINNEYYGGDGSTLFLKGGNDEVQMGPEEEKIYFGKGDDFAESIADGLQDRIYGGEGVNQAKGTFDIDDILKNMALGQ
ncbi:hypothetical protein NDN08_005343 [Rhodosorus marinus]|uniref:Uncharacterized protein n=1 Tax=Rhodosorus marinus TaxID=101924 RepID=A0AAV8V3P4_9RHOD|nr:hypothetical protein NDN08_005343 [Rhodosorus marinus]